MDFVLCHFMRTKIFFIFSYILMHYTLSFSQSNDIVLQNDAVSINGKEGVVAMLVPYQGDFIPMLSLPEYKVKDERVFKNKRDRVKYNHLVKKVRKVYPYAKLAGLLLRQYNDTLIMMGGGEYYKKKYTKKVEEELKKKFGKELENLTISEGTILIKLIDRETGKTSYELVKELRGAVSAVFWQTLAKIFGNSLKSEYDASGNDKWIEEIVQNIEMGAYDE